MSARATQTKRQKPPAKKSGVRKPARKKPPAKTAVRKKAAASGGARRARATRSAPARSRTRAERVGQGAPLVIIDNYDSFTWNLVQYLGSLGAAIEVFRNDTVSVTQLQRLRPRGLVISPGPGRPEDGGVSLEVIRRFNGRIPILGVCLGHQAIATVFGGRVVRATQVMHGKTSRIIHDGRGIFRGLENPFEATRYHSLVVERQGLPETLEVTCSTSDAVIMGLKVHGAETWGVQFHPESILTRQGRDLLRNFLDLCGV